MEGFHAILFPSWSSHRLHFHFSGAVAKTCKEFLRRKVLNVLASSRIFSVKSRLFFYHENLSNKIIMVCCELIQPIEFQVGQITCNSTHSVLAVLITSSRLLKGVFVSGCFQIR